MSFTKTFPIDIGTYVIVNTDGIDLTNPKELVGRLGTVACYQCVDETDDEEIVMISGYKDSWCGEYLLSEIIIATEEQVNLYRKELGIKQND